MGRDETPSLSTAIPHASTCISHVGCSNAQNKTNISKVNWCDETAMYNSHHLTNPQRDVCGETTANDDNTNDDLIRSMVDP